VIYKALEITVAVAIEATQGSQRLEFDVWVELGLVAGLYRSL
jgi:hypothetical protein